MSPAARRRLAAPIRPFMIWREREKAACFLDAYARLKAKNVPAEKWSLVLSPIAKWWAGTGPRHSWERERLEAKKPATRLGEETQHNQREPLVSS